jgi:hypothetical protein
VRVKLGHRRYSTLHKSLDAAVVAGDAATAESVARTITARLEAGRQQIAYAAGWQPASPMMAQLDRVFLASRRSSHPGSSRSLLRS